MLVIFSTKAHENVTMFGDVAIQLIKMMGHSETVPGAILAEDVAQAYDKLNNTLRHYNKKPLTSNLQDEENNLEVSIDHRALPLLKLLQSAMKQKSNVMWNMYSRLKFK